MLSAEAQKDKEKPPCYAIRGVRVFDGRDVIEKTTLLVREGKIEEMGPGTGVPADAIVIEGAGKTLLPGLIDSHTHVFGNGPEQALQFGVTTQVDMFTMVPLMQEFHRRQAAGPNPGRADLFSCGTLATVPGGHGTEYGLAIPTLSTPAEAQAFVDARVEEGSDFIKIIYGRGWNFPCLDKPTLAALIAAAHKRGKLAAVHVDCLQDARDTVESGADILAHTWEDREPDATFFRLARRHRVVLIPTLTVIASICRQKPGAGLIADLRLEPLIPEVARPGLLREFPDSKKGDEDFRRAQRIARLFKKNGLRVLAGTDAPNPGTAYGASLHQELEFLVQAGFSPAEALGATTALPAKIFGLVDRGRIAKGLRADLLLVEGDPLADIKDTRRIVGVWKDGMLLDGTEWRDAITREKAAVASQPPPAPPPGLDSGLISDFEDGSFACRLGMPWQESTDSVMGGKSTVQLKIAAEGAQGSRHSLSLSGEVAAGGAIAWSGAVWFPAGKPFAPADLSAKKAILFRAKGDGQTYQVLFYSRKTGFMPAWQS
ncbi:MAG: CIA30 family protein, partial [Candidatus Aminicenantes bacterium]|nr:CIA30 family protein [Candidatus Aminicenantes bacterium]